MTRLPRSAAAITSHPPQTHRTSEVIEAEIAAVDAFEGTKNDAFEALCERWGHSNAAAMKNSTMMSEPSRRGDREVGQGDPRGQHQAGMIGKTQPMSQNPIYEY